MPVRPSASLVAFMDDLVFLGRIKDAADGAGLQVQSVREPAALLEACRFNRPVVVLVDLESPHLAPLDAVAAVRSDPELQSIPVVGFLGQAEAEAEAEAEPAQAAQEAGCTRVVSRGAFARELPALLLPPPLAGDGSA